MHPHSSRITASAWISSVAAAALVASATSGNTQAWSEAPEGGSGLAAHSAMDYSAADRTRRLAEKGMTAGSPVMIRIFKGESELELWMQKGDRFELFGTYPICFWSGRLGPKLREGDKQAPEGFYLVGNQQLIHRGRLPRSFDIGFPNRFDRSYSRTGSAILVHGACQSIGCYAMTDPVMDEIFALTENALLEGQTRVHVHVFPFRMTEPNLDLFAGHKWHNFWLDLKIAYDQFERTRIPPKIGVCDSRYIVSDGELPADELAPAGSWDAMMACEKEEAEAALWQLPAPEPQIKRTVAARRVINKGRNARKAYAAARRARVLAHSKRMRTSSAGNERREH